MAIPRPRQGLRWLLAQPALYDVLIAGGAFVVGISAAANYAAQRRLSSAWAVATATVFVLVLTVIKYVLALGEASHKESMHELEGCLHTLHAVLDPSSSEPPVVLRLAVHVPAGGCLQQVTEYIGGAAATGGRGRKFSPNAGIIGKAYRENAILVAQRANDDYELFVRELVTDWNYTDDQARTLSPGVMQWMAVPLFDPDRNRVEAVLYLDASQRDFFSDERLETVLLAMNGIAVFIGKRYA